MKDYNTQLRELQRKQTRKSKVEAMLQTLPPQLVQLQNEERRLDALRTKEQADVEQLEKSSLAAFFYTVIRKKEEKLEKELAEAYAAEIKHDSAVRQLEATQHDIASLEVELQTLSGIATAYDKLFLEKCNAVKIENPAFGVDICRMQERLGYIAAQQHEIDEALSVGCSIVSQIAVVEDTLDSAEGWGTWDLLGGGLISDLAKYSHLDDAQTQINALQTQLQRYRTELADTTVQADVQAQIDGFLRFADYFFDGLFADWLVLDRIHSSQEQISSTSTKVDGVQHKLERMKSTMQEETNALNACIHEIVIKA